MGVRRRVWIWAVVVLGVLAGRPGFARGQSSIPDSFTNLQVLDEDISRSELLGIMRGITFDVGAETCSYCHEVSETLDQPDDDFASDAKRTKVKARTMLEMVRAINDEYLASLPNRSSRPVDVTCATCHAGKRRPTTVVQELTWVVEEGGPSALRARYEELRDRYFGRAAFDFGPGPLEDFARRTGRSEPRTALAAIDLNLAYHPESVESWLLKGQLHTLTGELQEAVAAYERVLRLVPDNAFVQNALQRLREEAGGIQALSFMVGCWAEDPDSPNGLREIYAAPASNMMTGLSQLWRNGEIVDFEFLRIDESPEGPVLTPHPDGVGGVSFSPVEVGLDRVAWENASHDFPQRIQYRRVAHDTLVATISAVRADSARAMEWRMARVACPDSGS